MEQTSGILIVEDIPFARTLAAQKLRESGLTNLAYAATLDEAVAAVSSTPDQPQFKRIVLDAHFPLSLTDPRDLPNGGCAKRFIEHVGTLGDSLGRFAIFGYSSDPMSKYGITDEWIEAVAPNVVFFDATKQHTQWLPGLAKTVVLR
ncbi:MAG TPA: response regulator [Candidatus Saccharimonadales bacterium]|nr:response regulator [Candidatus Saccharimonadales bacterium]